MAPYETLYYWRCRSSICWDDVGERRLLDPKEVQQTMGKARLIKKRIPAAESR